VPPGSLVFEPRTVVVALAVGIGVTVVSALGPARRAVRIPPVAALSDRPADAEVSLRRRLVWGGGVGAAGAVLLAAGLTRPAIQLVGAGAVGVFVGTAMVSPAIVRPLSGVIGRPLARLLRVAGRLGRENSMRNPQRTAQTAAALMVGLALVSAISVFGASLSRSTTASVDQAISADLIVTASGRLTSLAPAAVAAVPGVSRVNTVHRGQFEFRGAVQTLTSTQTQDLPATLTLRMTAGTAGALSRGELLVDTGTATTDHLSVGDTVPVKFAGTGPGTIRIGGIYQPNTLIGSFLVSDGYYLAHFASPAPAALLVRTTGTVADRGVTRALARYPNIQVQTRSQFEQASAASVNQLLGLVYALLGLAVIIALIGIVNTLMLSVFERTREIGLLRAVGLSRRQVRTMIRSEAIILAIFGAIIGIVIGSVMGVALVAALRHQGITETVLPAGRLLLFLVLSGLLGLVAASWPARRAARLDVLRAIVTE
jgi:putative ABC transport system permease protein